MIEFKFPDIGEGIAEGKLLKWMVNTGDKVKEGDTLFLVETDKVNAEIPSPASGTIVELMAKEGDIIYVGHVIVKINDGAETPEEEKTASTEKLNEGKEENAGVVGAIEVSSEVIESSNENKQEASGEQSKVLATPVARKLAKDLGLDIRIIKGTGPAGRVMKDDIYNANKQDEADGRKSEAEAADIKTIKEEIIRPEVRKAVEVPKLKITGEVERVPLTTIRKTIAKNMVLSKSVIPHAAVMDDFDVTELVKFRSEVKAMANTQGVQLTYMPFIIKAIILALKEFPMFNASFDEDNEEAILKKYYNIGVAVDTPEGLMVPVVKDADKRGVLNIAKELGELIVGSRERSIPLDKLQDGTFTITNYGAIGASFGVPVIRYPESAILGVGKITKKPVIDDNDEIVIRHIMPISLCIDHRIIDGGDAGRFLNKLKAYLKDPMLLLMS